MKASRIQSFVSEAQRELAKITPQIEVLTERRNSLQEVVAGGLKLLKRGQTETPQSQSGIPPASEIQRDHPAFSTKREVWQTIAEVLKQTGRPMMPKEIVEGMEQLGTPVSGKFPRDSVRSAMNRKADIFERMGQGWGLKVWTPDAKQGKQARLQ